MVSTSSGSSFVLARVEKRAAGCALNFFFQLTCFFGDGFLVLRLLIPSDVDWHSTSTIGISKQ